GRGGAAEPLHLVDPRIGNVLRAPVTSNRQAAGDIFSELAESVPHALANRLERRPPIAQLRRVPAHLFVQVVIDRAEEPAPAVALRIEARRIGPPTSRRAAP